MKTSQITSYSKLKDGPMASETFQQRGYLEEMTMKEARMFFRVRSNNTQVKMNQRSDAENARKLWKCSECGYIDS